MPTVSLISPVYKAEAYLEDTVRSVLAQTFTDWELILVDDGSPDGCPALCDRLAAADERIRVIHQPNGGVSVARNTGLDAARGDYIGWIDSDDLISPVLLETLYTLLSHSDADFVQCMHTRDPEKLVTSVDCSAIETVRLSAVDSLKRIYTSHYTNSCALWSKLWKRELFDGLRFPPGRVYEDDTLIPQLIARSGGGLYFELPLYCYIKRENSIITGESDYSLLCKLTALEERVTLFSTIDRALYLEGYRQLYGFLRQIFCRVSPASRQQVAQAFLRHRQAFWALANRYDRLYLQMIRLGIGRNWIARHDFEPIQQILQKLGR